MTRAREPMDHSLREQRKTARKRTQGSLRTRGPMVRQSESRVSFCSSSSDCEFIENSGITRSQQDSVSKEIEVTSDEARRSPCKSLSVHSNLIPDNRSTAASVDTERDTVMDDLQEIKAATMHKIVEDVVDKDGVNRKIVFLTNAQAQIITKKPDRVKRLVAAFEMPEPKLMINLLPSFEGTELIDGGSFFSAPSVPGLESIRAHHRLAENEDEGVGDSHHNRCVFSWENKAEYFKAARRLGDFMKDVLIPLAVETHAVIICDASYGQCILAMTLGRMVGLSRANWGADLPFTIIGVCSAMPLLYSNPDEMANWRYLRRNCRAWKQRDKRMWELMERDKPDWGFSVDLDPNVSGYLLFDSIDERKHGKIGVLSPANLLVNAFVRQFQGSIPSVAIKTGMSWKEKPGDRYVAGLSVVVDSLSARTPVVGLDLRSREPDVHKELQDQYEASCENIKDVFPDIFDMCALSFFHRGMHGKSDTSDSFSLPLHQAIEEAEKWRDRPDTSKDVPRASTRLLPDKYGQGTENKLPMMCLWLAEQLFRQAWEKLPIDKRAGATSYEDFYGDYIQYWIQQAEFILSHDDFHGINVSDTSAAEQLLRDLVKLDRMPAQNNLEGLRLMRRLWNHHDIANYHASCYKIISKVTYFLQLVVQVSLVICSTTAPDPAYEDSEDGMTFQTLIPFVFSLSASSLIVIHGVINPTRRWRQLRGSAKVLESTSWKYRTRVDDFAIVPSAPSAPEAALSEYLRTWLDDLVSGTDLESSNLGMKYKAKTFKHGQLSGGVEIFDPQGDDFHSPVKPHMYIQLRIMTAKDFYSRRISPYCWWRYFYIFLGLLCTACATLFSFVGLPAYVGIPGSTANAISAWAEFGAIGQKIERYNYVVRKLEKLLIWWDGLGEVEQAATVNIRKLVLDTEALISGEYMAWQSIASNKKKGVETSPAAVSGVSQSTQGNAFNKVDHTQTDTHAKATI